MEIFKLTEIAWSGEYMSGPHAVREGHSGAVTDETARQGAERSAAGVIVTRPF
jgi:hypothetical protein